MKKFSLILSIALLLSSVFCIMAGATAGTVIESQELYAEIPRGYEFSPYYDDDLYFTFANEDNLLYIDMRENTDVTDGIEALSQKELEKLIIVDFLLEGDEESAAECSIKFNDISIKNINEIKRIKNLGVEFVLASGRSLTYTKKIAKIIDSDNYIISNNGALAYDNINNKVIYASFITKENLLKINKT